MLLSAHFLSSFQVSHFHRSFPAHIFSLLFRVLGSDKMHQFKSFAVAASFLASTGFAQQSAWGQCGGIGWTGATTCVSGYTCVKSNDYYSQCVPGTASTSAAASSTSKPATTLKTTTTNVQTSAPASTATGTPTTGAGAGTTLQSGYYWIRAVESPYFHYYLQSEQLYSTGTGVLGSYTTAGQFQVVDGQLVQLISAPGAATQLLYGIVSQTASFDGRKLSSM